MSWLIRTISVGNGLPVQSLHVGGWIFRGLTMMFRRGEVKSMPKSNIADMNVEMGLISKILRQRPEIRDIVLEVKTHQAEIIETEQAA